MHLASHFLMNLKYKYLVRTAESWTLNDGNWQSTSKTNLDIADGIVACKISKPCEVEIIILGLRSTTSQLHSRNCIAKSVHENNKPNCFPTLGGTFYTHDLLLIIDCIINIDIMSVFNIISQVCVASVEKRSQEQTSQYIFSTSTIPRNVTVCRIIFVLYLVYTFCFVFSLFVCVFFLFFVFVLIFKQDLDWEPNSIDVSLICIQSQLLLIIKEWFL
jgi:hypothetical protein